MIVSLALFFLSIKFADCISDCGVALTIQKCCPFGQNLFQKKCTISNDSKVFETKITGLNHGRFTDNYTLGACNNFDYYLDQFSITEKREILINDFKTDCHYYCIEYDSGVQKLVAILCLDLNIVENGEFDESIYVTGMIISMPFLLATFIAYALLPDRNLHMKALMSYVINLMFGYLLLVIIQLSKTQFSVASCKSLGYFCLFFFMVSFFWMNVICIDIWFGFSGYRGFSGSKSAERKRFLLYCAYAWGMSILHILTVLLIDSVSNPSSWYAPGIGNGQCFIKTGWAELLYFYGPMGILITINVTLFVITAFKIRSLKKDTAMLKKDDSKRHSYENDKQKFNLYVKLLFAMGVNWSMEIISWAVIWNYKDLSTYIWYLTDFCNAAYGVFIFFIFVFKKNIWKLLQKRYYSFIGKPHLAHSVGQTQTRTTSYSTANTSLHETTNHHPGGGGGGSHITETSVLTTEA